MKASSHEAWKQYREHNVDIFCDTDENCRKNTEEQEIHAEARRVPPKRKVYAMNWGHDSVGVPLAPKKPSTKICNNPEQLESWII